MTHITKNLVKITSRFFTTQERPTFTKYHKSCPYNTKPSCPCGLKEKCSDAENVERDVDVKNLKQNILVSSIIIGGILCILTR